MSVSSKILFLQAIFRTPLQIISGSSLQGDVLFLVLIDNSTVLLVSLYAVFIVHGELTLISLKKTNKQHYLCESQGNIYPFYLIRRQSLVWKFVLIIWPWDCYWLRGLISNFFRNFIQISQFLSHFGIFLTIKEEGVLHCCQDLTKKNKLPIKPPDVHAPGTIMLCLYYMFL